MNKVWLVCWDTLRAEIFRGKNSWGKNELLEFMNLIERGESRKAMMKELEKEVKEQG